LNVSPELLLEAFQRGYHLFRDTDDWCSWVNPYERGVLPLDAFHVPHGLRRTLAKNLFEIRVNAAFVDVLHGCANRKTTWLNETLIRYYTVLYEYGHAHSVEAWIEGRLAGGLFGVAIGGAFFGMSMFHSVTDASKVALHALVQRLRERKFGLLEIQAATRHTATFGAIHIPRAEYMRQLKIQLARECRFVGDRVRAYL
jgi:leucyl/phenylalanyl-tRNA--protein transferase